MEPTATSLFLKWQHESRETLPQTATNLQILGSKMRDYRKKHGCSLRAVARGMGVTPAYLSDVERGRRGIKPIRAIDFILSCRHLKSKAAYALIEVFVVAMILIIFLCLGITAVQHVRGLAVKEGIVVRKIYVGPYTTYVSTGEYSSMPVQHPEAFKLLIRGEVDGKLRDRVVEVPEAIYLAVTNGQWFTP